MKSSSKLDQLRAMREANASRPPVKVGDTVVMPDGETKTITAIFPKPRKAGRKAAAADTVSSDTVSGGVTVSWLAPLGQCPHCDKRRAQLQATMRKRRAKVPS